MWLLFKAELRRFRTPGALTLLAHLVVLGFLSRTSDLAQQPLLYYRTFAACYVLVGVLLGAYQTFTYARPAAWIQLIHRPLSPARIGSALLAAGAVWLVLAVALPLLLIAAWQSEFTARVVDLRHWMMALPALNCALIGYAAAAYAVLANRRIGFGVLIFFLLITVARAQSFDALLLQWLVLGYLGVLLWLVFQPAHAAVPASPWRLATMLAPTVFVLYVLILSTARFGMQCTWIMLGDAPATATVPPANSVQESLRSTDKDLMLAGLAASHDPSAGRWASELRAQEKLERYGPFFTELPRRQAFATVLTLSFNDAANDTLWTFSHDHMRFEGRGLADDRSPRGSLAPPQASAFASPTMPIAGVLGLDHLDSVVMLGEREAWVYEPRSRVVRPLLALSGSEVFASPPMRVGNHLAALSDQALYVGNELTFPEHGSARISLGGPIDVLSRVALADVDDGYLVSLTFLRNFRQESFSRVQRVLHVDSVGRSRIVATRLLAQDYPAWFRFADWWMSPLLDRVAITLKGLFAAQPGLEPPERELPPADMVSLAAVCAALSMFATAIRSSQRRLSPKVTLSWMLVNALLGPAGVAAFYLAGGPSVASRSIVRTGQAAWHDGVIQHTPK